MAGEPEDDELSIDTTVDEDLSETDVHIPAPAPEDDDADELEVSFGDEEPPAPGERENGLVKHLRQVARDALRERDEARSRAAALQPAPVPVGPKPTLEDCEYDTDRFETEYAQWQERKAEAERAKSEGQAVQQEAQKAWQAELRTFEEKRAELKAPDAQEAIDTAIAGLTQIQQAVIVKAADNAALVLAALGKHPARLAQIAAIQDPLKQAAAVARLEGTLKVTTKRRAPDPEEVATGTARVSQGSDQTLAKLQKQAEKTGDRTALIAYRKQQAAKKV